MARGTTLGTMISQLRNELGITPSSIVAQSDNAPLRHVLQRTQEILYDEYAWPHMTGVWYDVTLVPGQRYYNLPSQLNYERVLDVRVNYSDIWYNVGAGFNSEVYNIHDSDSDQRADPVERWRLYNATQFEAWPMPASTGSTLRFTGTRKLGDFIADSDVADLDDRLIVLTSAAEKLSDKARGKALQALASRRFAYLKANSNVHADGFRIGEENDNTRSLKREIVVRVTA